MRAQFLHAEGCAFVDRPPVAEGVAPSALAQLADYGAEHRVDFVALAGGLAAGPELSAAAFEDAYRALSRLRALRIPVFAVEGRQDRRPSTAHGLRDVLRHLDLLRDLDAQVLKGAVTPARWDAATRRGCFADVGRVRVYGVRFYGQAAGVVLRELLLAIPFVEAQEIDYTVALLHLGPCFDLGDEQLRRLAEMVDYLAVGGLARHARGEGKVYAVGVPPGAAVGPGFFHVAIDTQSPQRHQVKFVHLRGGADATEPAQQQRLPLFAEVLGDGPVAELQQAALAEEPPEAILARIEVSLRHLREGAA